MPYICLARSDIPDGIIQVLDLSPNTSLRNEIYDPQGQTRYVNRVQVNTVPFTPTGYVRDATDGLKAYLVDRVEPGPDSIGLIEWTEAHQAAVAGGLVTRLDAGATMTLADVNAVIQATFPTSDFDGTASNSTGVLTELLAILSGRGYRLPAGGSVPKGPGGVWNKKVLGAFTYPVVVNGTTMMEGEIRPVNLGGDIQQREVKGIRYTAKTGAFMISIASGALATFENKFGNMDLWPDSDVEPFYPWTYQHGLHFGPQTSVRVVTVYDDDGTTL